MANSINENSGNNGSSIEYGDHIVGVWRCPNCGYECFPRRLRDAEAQPPFRCAECQYELYYDEEA